MLEEADMGIPTEKEWKEALAKRQGRELLERFQNASVAVCGLGGLGSCIALCLARAGIGKLILIDYDRVDLSNLHRQQYKPKQIGLFKTDALAENLKEINPYIRLETITEKITDDNFFKLLKNVQIVCEAFDDPEAKAVLVNGVLEKFPEKYLIAASGMAGLESANSIHTRKVMRHFYLCGDECSDVENSIGLTASRVMICASHQAHMVLRILAEKKDA